MPEARLLSHGHQHVVMKHSLGSCLSMEPILTSLTFKVRYLFTTLDVTGGKLLLHYNANLLARNDFDRHSLNTIYRMDGCDGALNMVKTLME